MEEHKNNSGVELHHAASRCGKAEIVGKLIDEGTDVNIMDKNGGAPLHIAAVLGNSKVLKVLTEKGTNVNAKVDVKVDSKELKKATPLHAAAACNHELAKEDYPKAKAGKEYSKVVKILIDAGAEVNPEARYGNINVTPFLLAVHKGKNKEEREKIRRILISKRGKEWL